MVLCVRVCWSVCLLYCEAFLGCIGQSGNVRIENFLGAHTLENVSGQSMGGIRVEHRAVCGERDSALPHLPPQQQQPRGPVRLRGLKIDPKQPPPASPSLAQGFHKPPAILPQLACSYLKSLPRWASTACSCHKDNVRGLSLGCAATLTRWRPQRQHSWAVASSPRPGQPCQKRT